MGGNMKLTHRAIIKALHEGKLIKSPSLLAKGWVIKLNVLDEDEILCMHLKTGATHLFPIGLQALSTTDWIIVK